MREDPDAQLASAAADGDRVAFETLLRKHYDRIHRLAWQLTGTRADADDIAQDVCCALVQSIGTFRGEAKFASWLCGITYNASRDLRRRRRTFGAFAKRLAIVAGLTRPPDGRDLHDAMWVKAAIARLPIHLRDTVALVVGEELTHAEAAAILGVKEATVSWRMHKVRRSLAGGDDPLANDERKS